MAVCVCVCVSGNQWSKMKAQTVTASQASYASPWQRQQHLLPGKSCHLARFRLSFEHLLLLTASCQKFGERANLIDERTLDLKLLGRCARPFASSQPPKMLQRVCQHLALCPYHSNAMVQSLMSACLAVTAELSRFHLLALALIHLYHSKEGMKLIFHALSMQFPATGQSSIPKSYKKLLKILC